MRFAFFSKAALEFLLKSNKHPDIIHCHDWQTGLVPVMLYEIYGVASLMAQLAKLY
jgi:starch synthase